MLCKTCGNKCRDAPSEIESLEIECVECDGLDEQCPACGGSGSWSLTECPRRFVGNAITETVNLISHAEKGVMPVAGGLLDQSAWFTEAWNRLTGEINRIDAERMERRSHG